MKQSVYVTPIFLRNSIEVGLHMIQTQSLPLYDEIIRFSVQSKVKNSVPVQKRHALIQKEFRRVIHNVEMGRQLTEYIEGRLPIEVEVDGFECEQPPILHLEEDGQFTITCMFHIHIQIQSITSTTQMTAEQLVELMRKTIGIGLSEIEANSFAAHDFEYFPTTRNFEGEPTFQLRVVPNALFRKNIQRRQMERVLTGIQQLPENIIRHNIMNYIDKKPTIHLRQRPRPLPNALSNTTISQPFETRLERAEEARAAQALEAARQTSAATAPVSETKSWWKRMIGKGRRISTRKRHTRKRKTRGRRRA